VFVTSDFPSENPRIQTRNYSYTSTLAFIVGMKKRIKILGLINTIGISIISCFLIIYISINPFAWSELLITLNLLTSIPFIISGIITIKNIEKPNKETIQNLLITVFLILWIPSIFLPFFYEFGGLLISLIILGIGIFGIFKIKSITNKIIFINIIGMFFFILNSIIVFRIITEGA
jgi:hypothetical protein